MISEFSIFVPWKAALGIEPPESSVPAAICSTAAVEVFLPGKCPDIARFSTRELCNKAAPGGPHAPRLIRHVHLPINWKLWTGNWNYIKFKGSLCCILRHAFVFQVPVIPEWPVGASSPTAIFKTFPNGREEIIG
jgi:hypothetical protein